jgi:hypothetical protein
MRRASLAAGAVTGLVLLAAATVLFLHVRVHTAGVGVSCGAPFDVVAGRADWHTWYAEDLSDPRLDSRQPALPRTDMCPDAVNRRTLLAGSLGAVALVTGTVAIAVAVRNRPAPRRSQLRTLGAWVTGVGVALTTAGLAALAVLLANPSATLFLYVDRWVVATVGMLALVPAIALAAGGRALMIGAPRTEDRSSEPEPS